MEDLEIKETKVNTRDETFIYIAVKDINDIKDIYKWKAEIKRDDVSPRTYVPPQFWEHFTAMNRLCKARRVEDNGLKTQVRFSKKDLEILTKRKGEDEPFEKVDMDEFVNGFKIPSFNHKM